MSKLNKKGIEQDMLAWIIIGIVALVIVLGFLFVLKGRGIDAVNYLKNIFSFGGI